MSIHPCIECDDEVRPRQQALQRNDYVYTVDHMAFLTIWSISV